jgi:hypothetical protein
MRWRTFSIIASNAGSPMPPTFCERADGFLSIPTPLRLALTGATRAGSAGVGGLSRGQAFLFPIYTLLTD